MNRLAVDWSVRESYRHKKWDYGVNLVISNPAVTMLLMKNYNIATDFGCIINPLG